MIELAETEDVLSVHMVLSETTRKLINATTFSALPNGAVFLNTSRAGLVDREALFAALRVTPHLGYVTKQTWRLFYEDNISAIEAFVEVKPIRTL